MKKKDRIYCARCNHMKVVELKSFGEKYLYFFYMVICEKRGWTKKNGQEQIFKYLTAWRRQKEFCEDYNDIIDLPEDYMKKLKSRLTELTTDCHQEPTEQTTDDLLFREYARQPFSRVL